MLKHKIIPLALALLLMAGCTPTPDSDPPTDTSTTTGGVESTTTATEETPTSTGNSATTTTAATKKTPTARALLGKTYADYWKWVDGQCRVIQARDRADVSPALTSDALPHYEILRADMAFKDWEQAAGLIGKSCPEEALLTTQTITDIYVRPGGAVSAKLRVGESLASWKEELPGLPALTVLYDFNGLFNQGFYGRIEGKVDGVQTTLYIDLTTDQAVAALKKQDITLGTTDAPYTDPMMGKALQLPELPVGGVRLWLEDKG